MNKRQKRYVLSMLILLLMAAASAISSRIEATHSAQESTYIQAETDISCFFPEDIPPFSGSPIYIVNDDIPFFTTDDLADEPYESYSELDSLGRCGSASAMLHRSMMPDWERENISEIKPTGWHRDSYDFIDGGLLYNRCHLIAFMFTGQGANPLNLITGTRYMNTEGMLPYEEEIASYLLRTGDHVLYRVTPVFDGDDLLASGVLMEARSLESDEICFCIYCYNVQPGIGIDYSNGDSWLLSEED